MTDSGKKNILLVGKETFMYPWYYLTDIWGKDNNIASLWVNHMETELEKCGLNESTYYAFGGKGIKVYSLNDALVSFQKQMDCLNITSQDISYIEGRYSHYKNINLQLISDQLMSVCYHNRKLYTPPTYEQQLLWLSCLYKNIEGILDDFQPDVIFDCDIAELPRTLLNEVAHSRGIPYISIAYSKYQMYKIPSYTLNLGVEAYFACEYEKFLKEDNTEEEAYVREFREKKSIKNSTYLVKGNPTYAYEVEPLIDTIKSIYGRWRYFVNQDKPKRNKKLKKQNPVLFVDSKKYMKFWTKTRFFRRWLYKTKSLFENPVDGESYVYMPLHLVPESTTYSIAPFWINELSAIEAVSKSLPAGWRLYVKEHQAMLGERSMDFYKKVKKIPNVRLVRFNYYEDPKPWIEKCRAVVTITGTAAYEAALMGKPAFMFGDMPYSLIKGVTRIREIEKLPELLHEIRDVSAVDNIKECAAYIRAVKSVGKSIDLGNIMNKAYLHLTRGDELDDAFWEEIDNLKEFFEDAYERADKRIKMGTIKV